MSPITTAALRVAAEIAVNGLTLLTPWRGMRWQAQQEQAHHQELVVMAQALPEGGQIRENLSDGTWTRLAVTHGGHGEGRHG